MWHKPILNCEERTLLPFRVYVNTETVDGNSRPTSGVIVDPGFKLWNSQILFQAIFLGETILSPQFSELGMVKCFVFGCNL